MQAAIVRENSYFRSTHPWKELSKQQELGGRMGIEDVSDALSGLLVGKIQEDVPKMHAEVRAGCRGARHTCGCTPRCVLDAERVGMHACTRRDACGMQGGSAHRWVHAKAWGRGFSIIHTTVWTMVTLSMHNNVAAWVQM